MSYVTYHTLEYVQLIVACKGGRSEKEETPGQQVKTHNLCDCLI